MSNYCSQCGSSIPEGQSICSMCMGDMSHGTDGYYEQWGREQDSKMEERSMKQAEPFIVGYRCPVCGNEVGAEEIFPGYAVLCTRCPSEEYTTMLPVYESDQAF